MGVAANTIWPVGSIASSAVNHMMMNDMDMLDAYFMGGARTPQIQADAVYAIITSLSRAFTGPYPYTHNVLSASFDLKKNYLLDVDKGYHR